MIIETNKQKKLLIQLFRLSFPNRTFAFYYDYLWVKLGDRFSKNAAIPSF